MLTITPALTNLHFDLPIAHWMISALDPIIIVCVCVFIWWAISAVAAAIERHQQQFFPVFLRATLTFVGDVFTTAI